jgi:hypothetical protein
MANAVRLQREGGIPHDNGWHPSEGTGTGFGGRRNDRPATDTIEWSGMG